MASVIEERGLEADILGLSAQGLKPTAICSAMGERGYEVSRGAVRRFLESERKARTTQRRQLGASAAAVITAQAGEVATDHVKQLAESAGAMYRMATKGYRTVEVPGQEVKHEEVAAGIQVRAAEALRGTCGYLLELAGADPPAPDATDRKVVLLLLGEAFGYTSPEAGTEADEEPGQDEHTPPAMH